MRVEGPGSGWSGSGKSRSHAVGQESMVRGVGEGGWQSGGIKGVRECNTWHFSGLLFLRGSLLLVTALFRGRVTLQMNLQFATLSICLIWKRKSFSYLVRFKLRCL